MKKIMFLSGLFCCLAITVWTSQESQLVESTGAEVFGGQVGPDPISEKPNPVWCISNSEWQVACEVTDIAGTCAGGTTHGSACGDAFRRCERKCSNGAVAGAMHAAKGPVVNATDSFTYTPVPEATSSCNVVNEYPCVKKLLQNIFTPYEDCKCDTNAAASKYRCTNNGNDEETATAGCS